MDSIKDIFKIGVGPSSSHTMGPRRAAERFLAQYPQAARFQVTLYGSLAATGKGHLTDQAILAILGSSRTEIRWEPTVFLPFHPNGMRFRALSEGGEELGAWEVYSIGGGFLSEGPGQTQVTEIAYPYTTMDGVLKWYGETGRLFWEYVLEYEGQPVFDHLRKVWRVMREAVERGLDAEGVLPGGLGLQRKASAYYRRAEGLREGIRGRGFLFAYALAVSEENAAGTGLIVTAPTCGSAGVLPAVLYYLYKHHEVPERRIIRALATAGLIGAIVKENASISGAEVGCQGEIGVACAMAAAAVNQIFGGSPNQIEYAAEMGLEHHLGLTCDPICGLVQIPCIERNAFAAARAMDANMYAGLSDGRHSISFDKVVRTMLETGHDLPSLYKETSTGGLAVAANFARG
ncbi:MAG: L-serine ammonia-lyase [Lentisphaeraceae bacterium]|nr:L-serine ammonia-lyase [Lentisphaeraceae bacterium]